MEAKAKRERQRRRRRATNQRTGASERRRRLWAWGQNTERMWAVWYWEGWVGVEWEMCEWEVVTQRETRWMQEAMQRRQWLAQARWLTMQVDLGRLSLHYNSSAAQCAI